MATATKEMDCKQKNQKYVHYFLIRTFNSELDNFTAYKCRLPFISYNHPTFLYLHYSVGSCVNFYIQENVVLFILNRVTLIDQ